MNYKRSVFTIEKIGLLLLGIYLFFSFNAHDIVIPTKYVQLSLYALLGWGVLSVFLKRNVKINIYIIWYFIFLCWSVITMMYSPETNIFGGEMRLIIVAFITAFIFQLFVNDEGDFEKVAWFCAISAFVLVATLHFTGNLVADANNRLGGDIMGNANNFAGMIMYAVMFEIWLIVYKKYALPVKICLFAMILVNYYALVLSAGRKFFVLPIIFLYILLLYKRDKKGRVHTIKYTLFIIALVAVLYYLLMNVPMFYDTIGYRMESLINGTLGVSEHGYSAAIREAMRNLAIEKWMDNPIVGHGFDSFKYLAREEFHHFFYSHCNYTELLYNGGVIYFVIYYWIYYKLIKTVLERKYVDSKYRAFAMGIALSLLVFDYGAVTYSISYVQFLIALSFVVLDFKTDKEDVSVGGKNE